MKRLTNKQLIEKIEELAKEVADLKARPVEHHHHWYPQPMITQPIQPYVAPQWPEPMQPTYPRIWYSTSSGFGDGGEATGGVVARVV